MPTITNSREFSPLRWIVGLAVALALAFVAGVSVATTEQAARPAICTR